MACSFFWTGHQLFHASCAPLHTAHFLSTYLSLFVWQTPPRQPVLDGAGGRGCVKCSDQDSRIQRPKPPHSDIFYNIYKLLKTLNVPRSPKQLPLDLEPSIDDIGILSNSAPALNKMGIVIAVLLIQVALNINNSQSDTSGVTKYAAIPIKTQSARSRTP